MSVATNSFPRHAGTGRPAGPRPRQEFVQRRQDRGGCGIIDPAIFADAPQALGVATCRHALRQQPIEDLGAVDAEVGEPVIVDRHTPRQLAIGDVALAKPLQFARRADPFDRRTEPQRHENRRIGGRPSRFAFAREHPIVKRREIEALDEAPDEARVMVRGQRPFEVTMSQRNCRRSGRTTRDSPIAHSPFRIGDERIRARAKEPISSHARKRE